MIEILAQIQADSHPKFTAGIVLWDDVVVEAAPIVGYMKRQRWTREKVRAYVAKQGWRIKVIREEKRAKP